MSRPRHESAAGATLWGIFNGLKKKNSIGSLTWEDRIEGKTCLVTGASSGLGKATAVQLAERGGRVMMACRSGLPEAGEEVKRLSGSGSVDMAHVNLADINSIYAFCEGMRKRQARFDIVVCNAGVVPAKARKTKQGFEEQFAVNYLANFILVTELLKNGCIQADGSRRSVPRIIFISSETHRNPREIDFENLGIFRDYAMKGSVAEYGYTKLLLSAFACELDRRLNRNGQIQAAVHHLCPGAVNTNIAREAPALVQPFIKLAFGLFFKKPHKACSPVIYLACSRDIEGRSGIYLHLMEEKPAAPAALDAESGMRLWEATEELIRKASDAAEQRAQ